MKIFVYIGGQKKTQTLILAFFKHPEQVNKSDNEKNVNRYDKSHFGHVTAWSNSFMTCMQDG
jgi:hypothetical protein